ncbi:SinR family protein [Burkholderia gladioli]|uniref:SinR family protein n=1 Tax=Burkholderia gladioli TaxID=28095 RepID=UPI0016404C2E|nr:SinR family protein [Burkholderia gladioli]
MPTYVVGYDLKKKLEKDYTTLFQAIQALGPTWRLLDSTWIVASQLNSQAIRDALLPHIHSDDKLLIAKTGKEAAWYGFPSQYNNWLIEKLSA